MLFTKLSVTSRSRASASPGATIPPASSSPRTFVGPSVAATRAMASTLDCSTRTAAAVATLTTSTAFVLCFPPRVFSFRCLTASWNKDSSGLSHHETTWLQRGGRSADGDGAGIFNSYHYSGDSSDCNSSRAALILSL